MSFSLSKKSFTIESILHLASHSLSFETGRHKVERPSKKKYVSMMDGWTTFDF